MNNMVPRRDILLAWLASLLTGCFGRSQAHAVPPPPLSPVPPIDEGYPQFASVSDPGISVTTHVYDASTTRLLVPRLTPGSFWSNSTTTSYTYDGSGRFFPSKDQPEG